MVAPLPPHPGGFLLTGWPQGPGAEAQRLSPPL